MKRLAKGRNPRASRMETKKLTTTAYPNQTKRQNPKSRRDPVRNFYSRLHTTLDALQKIQKQLPPATWKRFISAYTQHWTYSLDHGETATAPHIYWNEWAEVQAKGAIGMDTDTSGFHNARNYHVYESPREQARRVLGLEAAGV
jgi:hypothetical protein